MLPPFPYIRAATMKEAVAGIVSEKTHIHAGGTDLLTCLHDHVFETDGLVSISRLDKLRGIQKTSDNGLRIGALTTITEVSEHPLVHRMYPGLAQGASEVASPQLRNQGTIGGNLCQKPRCWYYRGEFHCLRKGGDTCYAVGGENQFHCILGGSGCFIVHPSDTAPPLISLDARVRVQGRNGSQEIKVENLHMPPSEDPTRETVLEPGEIITEIILPPPGQNLRSSYRKVRARRSWDFALAGLALALWFEGDRVANGRVVFSGVAPVPWRSQEVEEVIRGKRLDETTIARAAEAAVQNARPMSGNGYKVSLLKGVIEEELNKMAAA
ncbi:MAG: FAD binding domain-containing protein [Desulfovibrionales bacterium]